MLSLYLSLAPLRYVLRHMVLEGEEREELDTYEVFFRKRIGEFVTKFTDNVVSICEISMQQMGPMVSSFSIKSL